jgi:hypothetical protein
MAKNYEVIRNQLLDNLGNFATVELNYGSLYIYFQGILRDSSDGRFFVEAMENKKDKHSYFMFIVDDVEELREGRIALNIELRLRIINYEEP